MIALEVFLILGYRAFGGYLISWVMEGILLLVF